MKPFGPAILSLRCNELNETRTLRSISGHLILSKQSSTAELYIYIYMVQTIGITLPARKAAE